MFHVKINEINERCRRDPAAFIEESERSYTNVIESIADCVCENRYDRTILLLNGPSSSGKTTTSHRIRDAIERRGICSYAISMDDYYLSRGSDIVPKDEEGHDDLESPLCMDLPMLSEHLAALVRGETIEVPTYDFMRHIRTDEVKEVRLEKGEIAVIEGIHALNDVLMGKGARILYCRLYGGGNAAGARKRLAFGAASCCGLCGGRFGIRTSAMRRYRRPFTCGGLCGAESGCIFGRIFRLRILSSIPICLMRAAF